MKCIYCNADNELTSSDIITYAITGAKLTKAGEKIPQAYCTCLT